MICSCWDSEHVQGGEEALSSIRILLLRHIRATHTSAYKGCSSLKLWCSNQSPNICNWPPDRRVATCNRCNMDLGLAHAFIRNICAVGSNVIRTSAVKCSNTLVLVYRKIWPESTQPGPASLFFVTASCTEQRYCRKTAGYNLHTHLNKHGQPPFLTSRLSHIGPLLC